MWALVMGLSAIVVLLSVRWLLVPRVSNYMAGTTPSSNQDRPRWRQRHAKLTARLYLILGPLVAAGFAWFLPARGKWRAVLEAVTGNWPNGDAISTHWLAVCVGLIVFVTIGVPILLGSYVNDMIKASEVRITNMRLEEYLQSRDRFMTGMVTATLNTSLREHKVDVSPGLLRALVQDAVQDSARNWHDALEGSKIGQPEESEITPMEHAAGATAR